MITPFYISVSWTLLISYQMFTQTAVTSVVQNIAVFWPSIGNWLNMRADTILFVHAFAWIWVLSSMVPSVILGQGRSVLVQFLVCLILAFGAVSFADIFSFLVGTEFVERIFKMSILLESPWLAGLYLLIPYLMMFSVDLRGRRKHRLEKENAKATAEKQETQESPTSDQTTEGTPPQIQDLADHENEEDQENSVDKIDKMLADKFG